MYDWYLHTTRKYYDSSPVFVHADSLPKSGYTSLYAITKEAAEAIKQEGTTTGFKGVVWSPQLQIDFDSYDQGRAAESKLKEMGYAYDVFDSGGRGLHFSIHRDHAPSHLLPQKDKQWVHKHFSEADTSIYTHLHLFRLPGTIHEKTGRVKQLIQTHPGQVLRFGVIEKERLSLVPRISSIEGSVFDSHRIMGNTVPTESGQRHPTLVRLAYALKDYGVAPATAFWWIDETNKMFPDPKTQEELEQIIRSVY